MKKEEKTKLTKEKIIQAAFKEFGSKNYDNASINAICQNHKISKGLIYHNFKNKDELYLECVKICYQKLLEHSKQSTSSSDHIHKQLEDLIQARHTFFKEHPYLAQIFFYVILSPPQHLTNELKELRKDYDDHLKERYTDLLKNVKLRPNLSLEKAVQYFFIIQEMYNNYFRNLQLDDQDLSTIIELHESRISELLDILLYGISSKDPKIQ